MSLLDNMFPIQFVQSWGGVEWIAKQEYGDSELEKQIENIFTPDKNIGKALSSMFNAYYPDDLFKKNVIRDAGLENKDRFPWEQHQELFSIHKSDEAKYKEELRKILTGDWILTWHWRAVLPTLKNWGTLDGTRNIIVQISHFRKWEMLLCYSIKKSTLTEFKSLKEIPLSKKRLLRAPLFGISHRLKGWDTYRLFYSDSVKTYINKQFKCFEETPYKVNLSEILGRHDCYYIVDDVKLLDNGYKWFLRSSIETEPEISIIDIKNENLKHKSYKKPLDIIEIPSFGDEHKGITQLLSSDNYCEAIYELMEILNDPTANSVLIIAPPGSGKEMLAEFAFHCREIEKRGEFVATTLAGLKTSEVAKILFSSSSVAEDDFNINDFKPTPQDGLILRALDGALFIDEIDKADRSVRDLLLRVLESGEITDPDNSRILKIKKRKPLYIFSGSMSRKDMLEELPLDFWTRISHIIEVTHPLAIDDEYKVKKVTKDYLWMFWSLQVKDFMGKRGLVEDAANELTKHLIEFNVQLINFLLNESTINFVCNILSEELSGRGKPLVSIRTLRSVVARSLFKFLEVIQFSKFDYEPIEVYKLKHRKVFENKSFKEWFDRLLEILSIDLFEKQKTNKSIDPLELRILENLKSEIRLGTKLAQ